MLCFYLMTSVYQRISHRFVTGDRCKTVITYDNLARTPDDYQGKKVKFYGKVLQVMEGDGEIQIRLAVNDDYDTVLYGAYDRVWVGIEGA